MPELTIVPMRQCTQLSPHMVKIGKYDVFLNYPSSTCTCLGFKYHRMCKHILLAEKAQCDWHEQLDGPAGPNNKCPKCGGETEVVMVGV